MKRTRLDQIYSMIPNSSSHERDICFVTYFVNFNRQSESLNEIPPRTYSASRNLLVFIFLTLFSSPKLSCAIACYLHTNKGGISIFYRMDLRSCFRLNLILCVCRTSDGRKCQLYHKVNISFYEIYSLSMNGPRAVMVVRKGQGHLTRINKKLAFLKKRQL